MKANKRTIIVYTPAEKLVTATIVDKTPELGDTVVLKKFWNDANEKIRIVDKLDHEVKYRYDKSDLEAIGQITLESIIKNCYVINYTQ